MLNQLYEKDTYTTEEAYMTGNIVEWDISKANISILLWKGLITPEKYEYLYNCPKTKREIYVGLMQKKDININKGLNEGFKEARKLFFEQNQLDLDRVISIRKDAVFLHNCIPRVTQFGPIRFVEKGHFTTFVSLPDNVDLFYLYDQYSKNELIEVKGISDNIIERHEEYMVDLLKAILVSAQSEGVKVTLEFIEEVANVYASREMDIGYYREFNNKSLFRTVHVIGGERYYIENIPNNQEFNMKYLDISYNYSILMKLYSIFASKCF